MTKTALGLTVAALAAVLAPASARADDASVTVGRRFADPPRSDSDGAAIAVEDPRPFDGEHAHLRRSPFRLALGPTGVTTGAGFGLGVALAADFGTGSVGGRLSATFARGEGDDGDGSSTPTGDAFGQYTGEVTIDFLKRGPLHPILGIGAGLVHVSRSDASGFAGAGTGRLTIEYALDLEDADVRLGADLTGGLVGPVDHDVKDLHAYALTGAHVAIGF